MIRRRRPNREIQFSFDSFLDVVANVVGIILRLILVAWAGARMYKGPPPPPPAPLPALETSLSLPEPTDPLVDELEQQRLMLIRAQAHLLEHLQQSKQTKAEREAMKGKMSSVALQRQALEQTLAEQRRKDEEQERLLQRDQEQWEQQQAMEGRQLSLSLTEIRTRSSKLIQQIEELKKKPSQKQALRYRTPVSAELQVEELQWECRNGRVTLLDVGALVDEIRRSLRERSDVLRGSPVFSDISPPVGSFRLRYMVERDGGPGGHAVLSGWEALPTTPERGETLEQALQPTSEFRRIVDNLFPDRTAVTFWVYEDSFPLYRRLRDYLHDKDIMVAGRPLLLQMAIASSKKGTASRVQD